MLNKALHMQCSNVSKEQSPTAQNVFVRQSTNKGQNSNTEKQCKRNNALNWISGVPSSLNWKLYASPIFWPYWAWGLPRIPSSDIAREKKWKKQKSVFLQELHSPKNALTLFRTLAKNCKHVYRRDETVTKRLNSKSCDKESEPTGTSPQSNRVMANCLGSGRNR